MRKKDFTKPRGMELRRFGGGYVAVNVSHPSDCRG